MTHVEGIRQALRELGKSEAQIADKLAYANLMVPNNAVNQEVKLKPGMTEKDFVEALKLAFRKMDAMTPKQRREVMAEAEKVRSKIQTHN